MPPGHALRPLEKRLLADLAEQAALAFRSARLAAELSGEVERLARRTDDLAASRRRLISAGDAERSRLERAIGRQVTPHLAPLPDQLRPTLRGWARADDVGRRGRLLAGLLASLNAALEALREITRGVYPAQLERSGLPAALASLVGEPAAGSPRGRRVGRRQTLLPARRGRGVLLRCRGDPRPRRSRPRAAVRAGRAPELVVTGTDRSAMSRDDIRDRVESAGGSVAITDGRAVTRRRGSAAGPHRLEPIRPERRLGDVARCSRLGHEGRRRPRRRTSTAAAPRSPGARSRIRRVASRPSMPGRFTSISTRSGSSAAATSRASSPETARPTTSKPGVSATTGVHRAQERLLVVDQQHPHHGHVGLTSATESRRQMLISGVGQPYVTGW